MATVTKTPLRPTMQTYCADFTIAIGGLTINGSLVGVRASDKGAPKSNRVSPDGNAVEQRYLDTVTGKFYTTDECLSIFHTGPAEGVVLTKDEVAEIRKSQLVKNVISVSIHDAVEVESLIYPADTQGYVFVPEIKVPAIRRIYNALLVALQNGKTLIGVCNLQNHEGLFRLTVWRGQLLLQKQCYAAEIKEHPSVEVMVVDTQDESWTDDHCLLGDLEALTEMLQRQSEPFNPDTYKNDHVERQKAFLADPDSIGKKTAEPIQVISTADVLASLELMGKK